MTEMKRELLDLARGGWRADWHADADVKAAIGHIVADLEGDRPCTLPVVRPDAIWWLSLAPTKRELRMYLDDLRAWLQRQDSSNVIGDLTLTPPASSPFAGPLLALAPQGYLRWTTPLDRGLPILRRLGKAHRFLASSPQLSHDRIPSLPALRLEFITAVKIGDWTRAEACIDEIDHWNLDHASGTLQMRIRLLDAQGETQELFDFIVRTRAWELASPRRIAAAIVKTVDLVAIEPAEARDGLQVAFDLFRSTWLPRLVQNIADTRSDPSVARSLAYRAAADGDRSDLSRWLGLIPPALSSFLRAQLPEDELVAVPSIERPLAEPPLAPDDSVPAPVAEPASTASPLEVTYWGQLHESIRSGQTRLARELITSLDSRLFDEPLFLAAAPDALLELLSDPTIEARPGPRLLLQEAVAALIDAFIVAPGFPRLAHLDVYLSLLDGLVELNGANASEADSQFLVGLVGAVAILSADACPRCEQVVRAWWERRPVLQRLDWLMAALDSLAALHPHPHHLADLYATGLDLAKRKGRVLSAGESAAWRTIGRNLAMSASDVELYLAPLCPLRQAEAPDVLSLAGFEQIAIVSLRDSSAREAAKELETRSGATVTVVTSLVAGADTRHAANADLILYVWAATSHATYRAFDGYRDRLEYVQGTGASSIVLAAERWATRRVTSGRAAVS